MELESRDAVWAVIRDAVVENTVVWDGESDWSPPEGAELVNLADWPEVGIGWTYNSKATVNKFVDNRPPQEIDA